MSLPVQWQPCPGCKNAMLPGAPRCPTCGMTITYCAAPQCHKPIYPDERTISYTMGKADLGEKSKQIYEKRDDDVITIIHHGCVIGNFYPSEDRVTFDAFSDRYGSLITNDIREQAIAEYEASRDKSIKQEVRELVEGITQGRICIECHQSLEEEQEEQQSNSYANGFAPLASYPTR